MISTPVRLRATLKSSTSFDWAKAGGVGLLLTLPLFASQALANPLSAAVTTGSASIATSANKTQIDQKSEDVVINWSSFNIGAGQTTQFVQPNAQAIAVNRIGGNSASQILGTLDANGRIVLINGNGMLFGKGAAVNVGSLIATSTGGSDSDVLNGKFTQAGNQNAAIVNQGSIRASQGGLVALVAPSVTNAGTINAKFGTVAVGAANKFTVDFSGDGLVSFATQGDVNGKASAVNSGSLVGANVSLTAHAAEGVATGVVTMSGIVTAQTAKNVGGTILLDAGDGSLAMTGTLNAAGTAGGGEIETSGHQVAISGHITAGQGGNWKIDPENLTIDSSAASTIDSALNSGTSVTEQTTSGAASGYGNQTPGPGDIIVASALSWNTSATLTLDSYHAIAIDAPITLSGAGGLVIKTNDGGTGGDYSFNGANVAFTDVVGGKTQGDLTINHHAYKLIDSVGQLARAIRVHPSGSFAFANDYDASADGTYAQSPVLTTFNGAFEGLGNTISNLTVADSTSVNGGVNVGLFAQVGSTGKLQDIGLIDANISSPIEAYVGTIAGLNSGAIRNVSATGAITSAFIGGGLVGGNSGKITSSYANVSATEVADSYMLGGLVGYNTGSILHSFAGGIVTGNSFTEFGNFVGGLVGLNEQKGLIDDSYATGAVTAGSGEQSTGVAVDGGLFVGGLVGINGDGASIVDSFATGAVTVGNNTVAGGLVGENFTGSTIEKSYSSGSVTVGNNASAGGFVGNNFANIGNSYSTGSVTGGTDSYIGGLNGSNSGTIRDSYASGLISAETTSDAGGFVGNDETTGGIVDSYWDVTTSDTVNGVGNRGREPGVKGLSTKRLQSRLPAGFSAAIWGENASINGGLPYLLALPPA